MKLKKVAAICAKQGAYYLFDEVEESGELIRQWLGDGRSAYPLCQRQCDFVVFRRTGNVRKWRIKVCSL